MEIEMDNLITDNQEKEDDDNHKDKDKEEDDDDDGKDDDADDKDLKKAVIALASKGKLAKLKRKYAFLSTSELENDIKCDLGWSTLHYAAKGGYLELCQYLVEEKKMKVDVLDNSGSTPLYRAVGFGRYDVVVYLVQKGASVTHANNNGDNMIHNSGWAGHLKITRFLVEKGADPFAPNKSGRSPIIDCIEKIPSFVLEDVLQHRVKQVSSYLTFKLVQYDFHGLDDQDVDNKQPTPVETMIQLRRLDCLSHATIRALFEFKWESFGKTEFFIDFSIYIVMLFLFNVCMITTISHHRQFYIYSDGIDYTRLVFELILLVWAARGLKAEWREFRHSDFTTISVSPIVHKIAVYIFPKSASQYFEFGHHLEIYSYLLSYWSWFDITSFLLFYMILILRILEVTKAVEPAKHSVKQAEYSLLAIESFVMYLRFIQYIGAFRVTGPMTKMISRMVGDFVNFFVVFICFIGGFALCFFVLLNNGPSSHTDYFITSNDFNHFATAFSRTFLMAIGGWDYNNFASNSNLAVVLFFLYLILVSLVLLNLVIAMFSNSYSLVLYAANQEFLNVRSRLIMRIQRKLGKVKVKEMMDLHLKKLKESSKSALSAYQTPGSDNSDVKEGCYFKYEPLDGAEKEEEMSLQILHNQIEDMMKLQKRFSEDLQKAHLEILQTALSELNREVSVLNKDIQILKDKVGVQ